MYGAAKNTGYLRHLTGVIRSQETCAAAQVAAPTLAGGDNPVNAPQRESRNFTMPEEGLTIYKRLFGTVSF